jgi:hypothetical protein
MFSNDSITNLETDSSRSQMRKNKNEMLQELFNKTSKDTECQNEIKNYFQNYTDKNVESEAYGYIL